MATYNNSFLALIFRMKYINRWNLMPVIKAENLSQHSSECAFMSHFLALIGNKIFGKSYNINSITICALYHDITEVITGDVPKGLHIYHLRYDDDNCEMQTLERKVTVNHAGSLVTAEEIDFGNQEYIELTDESDLNFLGVDSDFEHLLSGDIPTFDTLDEYINKDGGLTYD